MTQPLHDSLALLEPDVVRLYDLLMGNIEPELMSENMSIADEMYADETSDERKKRYLHYDQCFAVLEKRFDVVMSMWREELVKFKDASKETLKSRVRSAAHAALARSVSAS
jgi:hypothetical protein